MLTDGIRPAAIALDALQSASLRAGQQFTAVVQEFEGEVLLQWGANRLPLASAPGLTPGQTVQVEVAAGKEGLQLLIKPAAAQAAASVTPNDLAKLAVRLLEDFDVILPGALAAQVAPEAVLRNPEAAQQFLSVLFSPSQLGADLQQLAAWVQQAVASGALPASVMDDLQTLMGQLNATQSGEFRQTLEKAAGDRGVAARLAQSLESGRLDETLDALHAQLRFQVGQLRGNDALLAYVRGQGQLRRFERMAERILDRLAGGELQQLRGEQQPYVFLELPMPPDSGFARAQIHFFGEGQGKGRRFDKRNMSVALDLSTTGLGDLWVSLRTAGDRCQCHFRAKAAETVAAIAAQTEGLSKALEGAGFISATVTVALWDGNRARELAALSRPARGIDFHA